MKEALLIGPFRVKDSGKGKKKGTCSPGTMHTCEVQSRSERQEGQGTTTRRTPYGLGLGWDDTVDIFMDKDMGETATARNHIKLVPVCIEQVRHRRVKNRDFPSVQRASP